MYKVRFHLAQGAFHMMWKVKNISTGHTHFFNPDSETLKLIDCTLTNRVGTTKKINEGAHKTVCAWVNCRDIEVIPKDRSLSVAKLQKLTFNPRMHIHWFVEHHGHVKKINADDLAFKELITVDRTLFINESKNHDQI